MNKQNPYFKSCPHCQKEFNARRLNQKYCTYFCKVQFNNERARLRRLELLEMEAKIKNASSEEMDFFTNIQATSIVVNLPTPAEKVAIEKPNWREVLLEKTRSLPTWNYVLLGLGTLAFLVFLIKKRKNKAPKTIVTFPPLIPNNQNENLNESDQQLSIPVEISSVNSGNSNMIPLEKNKVQVGEDFFCKNKQYFQATSSRY